MTLLSHHTNQTYHYLLSHRVSAPSHLSRRRLFYKLISQDRLLSNNKEKLYHFGGAGGGGGEGVLITKTAVLLSGWVGNKSRWEKT